MPEVNMRQLRDTRQLKAWLRAGKTVVLRERDQVLGHIVPARLPDQPATYPDFATRAKELLGDRVLPGSEAVLSERGRY